MPLQLTVKPPSTQGIGFGVTTKPLDDISGDKTTREKWTKRNLTSVVQVVAGFVHLRGRTTSEHLTSRSTWCTLWDFREVVRLVSCQSFNEKEANAVQVMFDSIFVQREPLESAFWRGVGFYRRPRSRVQINTSPGIGVFPHQDWQPRENQRNWFSE